MAVSALVLPGLTSPASGAPDEPRGPLPIAAVRGPIGRVDLLDVRQQPGLTSDCTILDVAVVNRSNTAILAIVLPRVRMTIFNPTITAGIGDGGQYFRTGPVVGPLTRPALVRPFATGSARFVVCVPEEAKLDGDRSMLAMTVDGSVRWIWSGPTAQRRSSGFSLSERVRG